MTRYLVVVLVVGCYRASDIASCSVACGPAGECPVGSMCNADHVCSATGGPCGAPTDAPPDAPQFCYGNNAPQTWSLQICFDTPPIGETVVANQQFDTVTQCPLTMKVGTVSVCVIAGNNVTVTGTLRPRGSAPIVIVAVDTVELRSGITIDLAGESSNTPPAGGEPSECGVGTVASSSSQGAGGGAGGSFGTLGGRGGHGVDPQPSQPNLPRLATKLGGGCSGIKGGLGEQAGGPGGGGGGAIYIAAGMDITLDGIIDASGQGGGGGMAATTGSAGGGGGGGGSGGLIVLDAPNISLGMSSVLMANGGGGGGGGGISAGVDGQTSSSATPLATPMGGSSNSAYGGNGCVLNTLASAGINGNSAGGGGGSCGEVFVLSSTTTTAGTITPPARF